MQQLLSDGVLAASASATFKLLLICALIAWLLRTHRLPADTAPVLSQVPPVSRRTRGRVP